MIWYEIFYVILAFLFGIMVGYNVHVLKMINEGKMDELEDE